MELERKEPRLFFKQEAQDMPLNFLFLPKRQDQSSDNHEKNGDEESDAFIPKVPLSPKCLEVSGDNINVRLGVKVEVDEMEDCVYSQTPESGMGNSTTSSFLRMCPRNCTYDTESNALASSSSSDPPETSQACTMSSMSLFSLSEPVSANIFMSHDNSMIHPSINATALKEDVTFGPLTSTISIENLSEIEQISIKTDEVYLNGEEGQIISTTLSDNSENTSIIGSSVKNGEVSKKYSSDVSSIGNNLKEISAIALEKSVNDHSNSTCMKERRRGRRKRIESAHIKSASVSDDIIGKEKINEISSFKEIGQQMQCYPSNRVSPRRMKSKVYEHNTTMQTRSSSGSLPKTGGAQTEISAEKKLLQGHGAKKFHCTVNFMCPLCDNSYRGKSGLKRHFASKHVNGTNIPCPECKYKMKTVAGYLKHIEKHRPKQTVSLDSPILQESQPCNSQMKCPECLKLFQNADALSLHVIDHKISSYLFQAERLLQQESTSECFCGSAKMSNYSSFCLLHAHCSTSSSELHPELKLEVGHSLKSVRRLTSHLESIAQSLSVSCTPSVSSIPLPALNNLSTISIQLANLSTTLGHALLCHVQKNDQKDGIVGVYDPVDKSSVEETETKEETEEVIQPRNDESIHDNETVIAVEQSEVFVLRKDDGLDTETDKVRPTGVKAEEILMEMNAEPIVVVNPFTTKLKKHEKQDVALKVSKAPIKSRKRQARAVKHSKDEARHSGRERDHITWKKMLQRYKQSKSGHNFKCRECGKKLTNFCGLKRHLMIHRDERPYKCNVCKISFRRSDHLKKHMVIHSDDRPFKCSVCDYAAKTARTLHIHSLTHGEDKCFPCQKCSYKGRTAHELSNHEKKHSPCSLCSYVAVDNADYNNHKRSHLVYLCSESKCNYSCHTSWQMRRHSKVHNPPNENVEKFCCELCGYSCVEKRHFQYHMERHENKTPFSCSVCDYKCSSRASIDAHKLMHAGLRPFLCSICGASFRRSSHLNNHMLIHKDEKKHVCHTCERSFRARHNLRAHEMIHTGERKYKCQLCVFSCRRNRELRIHMAKHKVPECKEEEFKISESQKDSTISTGKEN